MKRCAIWRAPARRRRTIFGENASSFSPSCSGRIYSGGGHGTLAHRRWLASQKFDHAAPQIAFQEGIDAIEDSPAPASLRETARPSRAGMVHGAGRGSLSGPARRFVSRRRDFGRRDRRCAPVRYAKAADVVPRARPGGKLNRRHNPTESRHGSAKPRERGSKDCPGPFAISPGRRRSVCAPVIAASAPRARSRLSSGPRSPARWPLFCGRSDGRSRPRKAGALFPLLRTRERSTKGGERPPLVMWPGLAPDARPLD
jgi:hypothetical protein